MAQLIELHDPESEQNLNFFLVSKINKNDCQYLFTDYSTDEWDERRYKCYWNRKTLRHECEIAPLISSKLDLLKSKSFVAKMRKKWGISRW